MKTKEEVLKKLNDFNDKINYEFYMLGYDKQRFENNTYDYTEFKFTANTYYDREYDVLIVYQSSQADFKINSELGLAWLELVNINSVIRKDIKIMQSVFDKVEDNLLKLGIPFDNSYKFNQKLKYRKNKQNRAKYDLDNLERELDGVLYD